MHEVIFTPKHVYLCEKYDFDLLHQLAQRYSEASRFCYFRTEEGTPPGILVTFGNRVERLDDSD